MSAPAAPRGGSITGQRSSLGLILPPGYDCEDCQAKDDLIARLADDVAELREELERMYDQTGSALINRADRRKFMRQKRAGRKAHRPRASAARPGAPTRAEAVRKSELARLQKQVASLETRVEQLHKMAQEFWQRAQRKRRPTPIKLLKRADLYSISVVPGLTEISELEASQ